MAATRRVVTVDADSDLARLLDEIGDGPFLLKRNGASWRVVPERDVTNVDEDDDLWADYDPVAVRRALDATIGSWKDRDIRAMINDVYESRRLGSRPPDRP